MTVSPATTWRLSRSLSRAQLQKTALAVGAPVTGTKPQLLSNIQDLVTETKKLLKIKNETKALRRSSDTLRVLSIDMGVRNLAYALLEHQLTGSDSRVPSLIKWQRLSLQDNELSHSVSQKLEKPSLNAEKVSTITKEAVKESFEPARLAIHACRLARQFADFEPTHILIERQRFRSAGQAAVQEWSLRVGMLEAMLHALFRMLVEEKSLIASVESVPPARVNKYWFEHDNDAFDVAADDDDVAAENPRKIPVAKQAKAAKIALVTAMLQKLQTQTATFSLHPDLNDFSKAFLYTQSSKKSSRKLSNSSLPLSDSSVLLPKLDDLSDSLLQALAWLHWQENRLKVTES